MIKLSHIAIVVPNFDLLEKKLKVLSFQVTQILNVPSEKVKTAFAPLALSSRATLEFLEPTSKETAISKFLEKKKEGGLHHLCFEVTQLETWEKVLKENQFEIIPPGIRPGAHGKVLFIHPKSFYGVLVELEEAHHAV